MIKNKVPKGLNKKIIKQISQIKKEDQKILDIRLKAYEWFLKLKNPSWSNDIKKIDFNQFCYYLSHSDQVNKSWDDVPAKIKNTFKKLGIIEAEAKFLNGITTQYDSAAIYHSEQEELIKKGVIFCDTDTAREKYPELFYQYFCKLVPITDNKYAALNTAVWSGGTFIYVPKNTHLDKPLQSYFRINSQSLGQFERTLIIVDENSSLHYVEGCTAPVYSSNNLHAAVVEVFVKKNASMKYTTIQNWSDNVLNYVTKRAIVEENGKMIWIDGNIGSKHNIKFPCVVLKGDNAKGNCVSIAVANTNVIQDSGAKMIHLGKNTKSSIISKSIGYKNSKSIFRGLIKINENATNSRAFVKCDTLLVDEKLTSLTIPHEIIENDSSIIEHEASISKISDEQLFFLKSRGLKEEDAQHLLVLGFIDVFAKELPMEYAVELNRLLKIGF